MLIWIEESKERGMKTGVLNSEMASKADEIYTAFKTYYDSIKPVTYYGDICSKNVMIYNGAFSGLVDLDGLTQGDPLEAVGRIMLSWYGMPYGQLYTDAIMHELNIDEQGRRIVTMYAYLNKLSWASENGIQFNRNTSCFVDNVKLIQDRQIIADLSEIIINKIY
jgi:aminoglycoside phosphotransferase